MRTSLSTDVESPPFTQSVYMSIHHQSGAYSHLGRVLVHNDPPTWLAAVVASGLPRAGLRGAVPLKLSDFVGSIEMLAWAETNDLCKWQCKARTCTLVAAGGVLEVFQWARANGGLWAGAYTRPRSSSS